MAAGRDAGLVEGVEDLLVWLAGEQLDVSGGQAGVGVEGLEGLVGERCGGGEAAGDAAGFRSLGHLVSVEGGGEFGVVVERGQ